VNNGEDSPSAIRYLLKEDQLRWNLGKNARAYYERIAAPVKVIEQIVKWKIVF
jgi:hypothetical protein